MAKGEYTMPKWKPEFEIGDQQVDSQHKHLFEYVDTLHDFVTAVREGAPLDPVKAEDLLFDLDTYVTLHFAYEEMCMGIRRCPVAAANREAHDRLSAFYADFREKARQQITLEMLETLENTLTHWLSNHICRIDMDLKGKRPAPGGARPRPR